MTPRDSPPHAGLSSSLDGAGLDGRHEMVTITNDFHCTAVTIRKRIGEEVSAATARRVRHALCGMKDCKCTSSSDNGARASKALVMTRWNGKRIWYTLEGEVPA